MKSFGASFVVTKSFMRNHENHEKTIFQKTQNTQNTQKSLAAGPIAAEGDAYG